MNTLNHCLFALFRIFEAINFRGLLLDFNFVAYISFIEPCAGAFVESKISRLDQNPLGDASKITILTFNGSFVSFIVINIIQTICNCVCTIRIQGDNLEWLGCALYVAGQSSSLETVEGQTLKGNSVSLTQILHETNLK